MLNSPSFQNQEPTDREKLAARIRKLLALAGNNPSETEAAAALERASELMAEHNLTMAHIDALGSGDERLEDTHRSEHPRQTWARTIWGSVADLNFCFWCYRSPERLPRFKRVDGRLQQMPRRESDEHILVGTRTNIETTKLMALYLVETVERLASECDWARGVHAKHAFKLGCAERLSERLDELRRQRMAAKAQRDTASTGNSLPVLADVYAAHDRANRELYLKGHSGMPRGGSPLGTRDDSAYCAGQSAADGIGLNPQVRRQATLKLSK